MAAERLHKGWMIYSVQALLIHHVKLVMSVVKVEMHQMLERKGILFTCIYIIDIGAEIWHHVTNSICTDSSACSNNLQKIIKTETKYLQKGACACKWVPYCHQEQHFHTKAPPNQNTLE